MLQLNRFIKIKTVKDYKICTILIASLTGIFLLTLIGEKADAVKADHILIDQNNNNLLFRQIGNDGPWTLKVDVTDPPFGTDKVKVSINGPYGYKKIKWATVESENTRVTIDIPGGKIPVGTEYKLCVQTDTIEIILDRNCEPIYRSNSGDEQLTYSLNN